MKINFAPLLFCSLVTLVTPTNQETGFYRLFDCT